MCRAAFLPWPTATVTARSDGTMSPPPKLPAEPVMMFGPSCRTSGVGRYVGGRIATGVDNDAAAHHLLLLAFHLTQHRDRVKHPRGAPGRDIRTLGDVRADGEEGSVEAAVVHRVEDFRYFAV